jgi:hypothetical protein
MSTKSTIILTKDNEHWYEETNEPLGSPDNHLGYSIKMEFNRDTCSIEFLDSNYFIISINEPCHLQEIIKQMKGLDKKQSKILWIR